MDTCEMVVGDFGSRPMIEDQGGFQSYTEWNNACAKAFTEGAALPDAKFTEAAIADMRGESIERNRKIRAWRMKYEQWLEANPYP